MHNLILIMLIFIWNGLLTSGFFVGLIYLRNEKKTQKGNKYIIDTRNSEKELTPGQQREAEILKKQMQNFFTYNGEEQEEIIV